MNIATKKVECTVQGVQPIPRGLAIEQACGQLLSTTGHLILPASHASLQIYDPLMDRHVASVQVGSRQSLISGCVLIVRSSVEQSKQGVACAVLVLLVSQDSPLMVLAFSSSNPERLYP